MFEKACVTVTCAVSLLSGYTVPMANDSLPIEQKQNEIRVYSMTGIPYQQDICKIPLINAQYPELCQFAPLSAVEEDNNDYNRTDDNSKSQYYLKILKLQDTLQNNLERIDKISQFTDNWNGYGAEKFSNKFLEKIKLLINSLEVQPNIFPTARDSIQFEFENSNNEYLEIEIFSNDTITVYKVDKYDKESTSNIRPNEVNEVIRKFYGYNI